MGKIVTVFEGTSCCAVWVQAVEYLFEHNAACNVVLGVETPGQLSAADFQVQERVDHFFQRHAALPISTVATTIFPGSEYLHGGAPEVFNEFPKMFTKIRESGGWGTYAMRMLTRSLQGPEEKSFISPLEHLVTKMKRQRETPHPITLISKPNPLLALSSCGSSSNHAGPATLLTILTAKSPANAMTASGKKILCELSCWFAFRLERSQAAHAPVQSFQVSRTRKGLHGTEQE